MASSSGQTSVPLDQQSLSGLAQNIASNAAMVGEGISDKHLLPLDDDPHIEATIQDIGQVITTSRQQFPAKYAGAISFAEHDFFHPQQTVADCYILRCILHNWADSETQEIIRNLTPALRPGTRILTIEHVVPTVPTTSDGNQTPLYMEKNIRQMDVTMFTLLAGRERTEEDFKRLLREIDPRLELQSSCCPDGSALTVLKFQVTR